MPKDSDYNEGSISEWNEGNFKNLRLHEAQEIINLGKVNPFSLSEDETTWNYLLWKAGIDILYGEGESKYSGEEKEEIDKIRDLIDSLIYFKPPFKTIITKNYDGGKKNYLIINENQERIKKFLRLYERQVKYYNDKHGLSTRNKEEDLRGL